MKQAPDQKWALVDATVEKAPNLRGILFKENEGMYLIGAAYAMLAKGDQGGGFPASKSVGFVGAIDNALVRRWYNGYAQGVNDNGGEKVLSGWGNSFNDPATSKELALSQNSKGAKYIAGVAAAGNSGVFEAAADRNFFTSGVDVDERPKDPDHIILSMVKRSDQAVHKAVCDAAKGSFKGGVETLGIKENAVGPEFLTLPQDQLKTPSKLPQKVQDKLKDLKEQIASGKITVKQ
jgi:basic membrane protein A and related proteins